MGRPKKQPTTDSATTENVVAETSQKVVVKDEKKTEVKENIVEKEEAPIVLPLEDTDEIEVVSLIPNVVYRDEKTMDNYEWNETGDTEPVTFEVLKNIYRNYRGYFNKLWIKPLDERVIKKFGLAKLYADYDYLMDVKNYNADNIKDICDKIHKLPNASKQSVAIMLRDKVEAGGLQDIRVIKTIEKTLGLDLISLL